MPVILTQFKFWRFLNIMSFNVFCYILIGYYYRKEYDPIGNISFPLVVAHFKTFFFNYTQVFKSFFLSYKYQMHVLWTRFHL